MVLFNHATHQLAAKIVYYGPGLCGKTTNLNIIYQRTSPGGRGEMVSLNTDTDRTLFFDLLPMDMGTVWGFRAKLQLYTVPGQVFYNATRKLVLKGADGIVFVADSQEQMLEANKESLRNLETNLRELGIDPATMPLVYQWNKRDLSLIVPVETLERELNPLGRPSFCGVASEGTGVFETLKGIARQTLAQLKEIHFPSSGAPVPTAMTERKVPPEKPMLRGRLIIPAPLPPRPPAQPPLPRPAIPVPKVTLPRIVPMPRPQSKALKVVEPESAAV